MHVVRASELHLIRHGRGGMSRVWSSTSHLIPTITVYPYRLVDSSQPGVSPTMPSKRKSVQVDDAEPPTRSTRQKASSSQDVTSARESTPKKKIKSEKKPKNTSATKSKDAKEGPASEVVNSKVSPSCQMLSTTRYLIGC